MIGRLMVPVAGTIAALIVISLAREPRGPAPEAPAHDWPDVPEHSAPPPEEAPPEETNPDARTFRLELAVDGTLLDLEVKNRFATLDAFLDQVRGTGHTVVLSRGRDTTEAAFLDAMQRIQESKRSDGTPRFDVRPEQLPESQTFEIELAADGTLRDLKQGSTFPSPAELAERLGDGRHTLLVSNATGVTEAELDALVAKLQEAKLASGDLRYLVHKVYRAPEAPSGD